MSDPMLEGMTVDGSLRAIPYDAEPVVLFYNADAFAAAGPALPTTEYSREQFVADATALTTDDHQTLAVTPGMFIPAAWATAGDASWLNGDGELGLTHPAVATVVLGADSPEQIARNAALAAEPVDPDVWAEPIDAGLLRADVPIDAELKG